MAASTNAIVLKSLYEKRNDLERLIIAYEEKIRAAQNDLMHVNMTIQVFEKNGETQSFPLPVSITRLFKWGEMFEHCRMALEAAPQGLDTRELSRSIIRAKGWDEGDAVLCNAIAVSITSTLSGRARRKLCIKGKKRKGVTMWFASRPNS
jgi:hypothetical protein